MKISKKVAMVASFCLGAMMLVTTAFADITSKTGYDQLKDAVKFTAKSCSGDLNNFTLEGNITIRDGDKILFSNSSTEKFDISKGINEQSGYSEYSNGNKRSRYYYRDKECIVNYNQHKDMYNITEYPDGISGTLFDNPFEADRANDMEKIFDALVGNLKDYVIVEENSDGSKQLSGSISEAQIPALVNAFASYAFKKEFAGRDIDNEILIPEISNDIFVKKVNGKAVVNKDGILESIFASGVLAGKDKDGNLHELTVEFLGKIVDINKTSITKPDLTGKKVEKNTASSRSEKIISKKFIGKYMNDIIIETNDSFVKIGERVIEIAHIDDKHVSGRYYEKYNEGYSEYSSKALDFRFDAEIKDGYSAEFKYTNSLNNEDAGSIYFNDRLGHIYFNMNNGSDNLFDSTFKRIFDN